MSLVKVVADVALELGVQDGSSLVTTELVSNRVVDVDLQQKGQCQSIVEEAWTGTARKRRVMILPHP